MSQSSPHHERSTHAVAAVPPLITEEFMVPAVDPGIEIYVRNKRLQSLRNFNADTIVFTEKNRMHLFRQVQSFLDEQF